MVTTEPNPYEAFTAQLQASCPQLEPQDIAHAMAIYRGELPLPLEGWTWAKSPQIREIQLKLLAMGHATLRKPAVAPKPQTTLYWQDYAKCEALGVGPTLAECSLDNPKWEQTELVQRVRQFINQPQHHMLLLGNTGNGKTSAAVAWLARVSEGRQTPQGKQYNGLFAKAREISDHLGADKEAKAFRQRLETVRWLVVDDLKVGGEGTVSPAFVAYIDDLFDTRYRYQRGTVLTSNATPEQIASTYGDRLVSRFRQWGIVYNATGADLRQAPDQMALPF